MGMLQAVQQGRDNRSTGLLQSPDCRNGNRRVATSKLLNPLLKSARLICCVLHHLCGLAPPLACLLLHAHTPIVSRNSGMNRSGRSVIDNFCNRAKEGGVAGNHRWENVVCRPTACALAAAPARMTPISRESDFQKTTNLDRTGRGVGCIPPSRERDSCTSEHVAG
jgi:hypothetical protein